MFWRRALLVGVAALAVWGRFFYFWVSGDGGGHVQMAAQMMMTEEIPLIPEDSYAGSYSDRAPPTP